MSTQTELSEAVRSILRALAELSAAQAALDSTPDQSTAPRDHYARKAVAAFRLFEAGAQVGAGQSVDARLSTLGVM
jgi:hypothetical protein